MNGMELARRFCTEAVLPAFSREAPRDLESMAFGLVGPGSECYGFDDEISRDHDWGPRVCLWIPDDLFRERGEALQSIYDGVGDTFLGHGPIKRLDTRVRRDGIISLSAFYQTYLGIRHPPTGLREWIMLPEEALSLCTNGEVFSDRLGEFSRIRDGLLHYYPRDIWLKKLASRCKAAAQHGQYNLPRAFRRQDRLAQHHHAAQFMIEAARLVYLLRRRYRPFSKWLFRGLLEIGAPGPEIHGNLVALEAAATAGEADAAVERCAELLISEIMSAGLADATGSFLYDYAFSVERSVDDKQIREDLDTLE
jgi:uncharacterized protein DUF4037